MRYSMWRSKRYGLMGTNARAAFNRASIDTCDYSACLLLALAATAHVFAKRLHRVQAVFDVFSLQIMQCLIGCTLRLGVFQSGAAPVHRG
jgi:hypothetical protein